MVTIEEKGIRKVVKLGFLEGKRKQSFVMEEW